MANEINIENMSPAELTKLQGDIAAAIIEKKAAAKADTIDKVLAIITEAGFSFEELFGKTGKVKKAKVVKYRNDKGQTWSGSAQGRRPAWIEEVIKSGGDIEDYKV